MLRMLHESPLKAEHEAYAGGAATRVGAQQSQATRPGAAVGRRFASHIEWIPYGVADESGRPTCELIATYGEVEPEYAAIRRGAALLDSPHRGTIIVTGKDRRDFLNRMLTQELKDLAPGTAKSAFWLNRKGRIESDLLLMELGDRIVMDVDIHQAASTAQLLTEFVFSEDVSIQDASDQFHHIAIHGRRAADALAECGFADMPPEPLRCGAFHIANIEVIVTRRDQTAEPGYELIISYHQARSVWESLVTRHSSCVTRPVGWHAFNIARIEAGTPLFNIDFGPTNLPHETGILYDRVSFTKGCYVGQEVVARMENLGKPKQTLVGLSLKADALPVAGGQVFARNEDDSMGSEIGVVTSSSLSPMLGAKPIAFAMIKTSHAGPGTLVLVNAEGAQSKATVSPLRFWPPAERPTSAPPPAAAARNRHSP
jgi:folate-binding protein YgfZ